MPFTYKNLHCLMMLTILALGPLSGDAVDSITLNCVPLCLYFQSLE